MKGLFFTLLLSCQLSLQFSFQLQANTLIRFPVDDKGQFSRNSYPKALLIKALEITKESYGPYQIEQIIKTRRDRGLIELVEGKNINVYHAPANKEWETQALPIYFPIRKGLLSYRLLLIKSQHQDLFSKITQLKELKALKAGSGSQWSITAILKNAQFQLVTGTSYEGLFKMLDRERFDYFPRGINEIYGEFKKFSKDIPSLVIEKQLALYMPIPSYFYVSPKNPELKKRIETGLALLQQSGEFDALFLDYYSDNIKTADLKNRTIFHIENNMLTLPSVLSDAKYWYIPK